MVRVGIFALQGDVAEHANIIKSLGHEVVHVRNPEDLNSVDRFIIPGGESTVFAKLSAQNGLDAEIINRVKNGMPVFGTCAGMILLSSGVQQYPNQPTWNLMNIKVRRNAYGRQLQSEICDVNIEGIGVMNVAFIRAPVITEIGENVKILAYDDKSNIILAREQNILAGAFHPEITGDARLHEYFIKM